jgi:hypothetical protein
MMDYLGISGIVLGVLSIFVYVGYGIKIGKSVSLAQASILFLSANALVSGVKLCFFSFNTDLAILIKSQGIEASSILLGGIALCWVSILSIVDVYKKLVELPSPAAGSA